jgi:hypothetical protein
MPEQQPPIDEQRRTQMQKRLAVLDAYVATLERSDEAMETVGAQAAARWPKRGATSREVTSARPRLRIAQWTERKDSRCPVHGGETPARLSAGAASSRCCGGPIEVPGASCPKDKR